MYVLRRNTPNVNSFFDKLIDTVQLFNIRGRCLSHVFKYTVYYADHKKNKCLIKNIYNYILITLYIRKLQKGTSDFPRE